MCVVCKRALSTHYCLLPYAVRLGSSPLSLSHLFPPFSSFLFEKKLREHSTSPTIPLHIFNLGYSSSSSSSSRRFSVCAVFSLLFLPSSSLWSSHEPLQWRSPVERPCYSSSLHSMSQALQAIVY
jgi:hypothetical protein